MVKSKQSLSERTSVMRRVHEAWNLNSSNGSRPHHTTQRKQRTFLGQLELAVTLSFMPQQENIQRRQSIAEKHIQEALEVTQTALLYPRGSQGGVITFFKSYIPLRFCARIHFNEIRLNNEQKEHGS